MAPPLSTEETCLRLGNAMQAEYSSLHVTFDIANMLVVATADRLSAKPSVGPADGWNDASLDTLALNMVVEAASDSLQVPAASRHAMWKAHQGWTFVAVASNTQARKQIAHALQGYVMPTLTVPRIQAQEPCLHDHVASHPVVLICPAPNGLRSSNRWI
jgi:hypothetical protein